MTFFDVVAVENREIKITQKSKPFLVGASINGDGESYYDFQKTITEKYACVICAENGVVRYLTEDPSTIAPHVGERVFGIDDISIIGGAGAVTFDGAWVFNGKNIIPRTYTREELTAQAKAKRDSLMAKATAAIAPLQDAVDLNDATDNEQRLLKAWKAYRVALSRLDLTTAPDIDWPLPPA